MRKIAFTALFSLALSIVVHSQSSSQINSNNINATINNNGTLFNKVNGPGFEVPKDGGAHAIFSAMFSVTSQSSFGQLMGAATDYSVTDFQPGPIIADEFDDEERPKYDRIFSLNCNQIADFIDYITCLNDPSCDENTEFPNYSIPSDIMEWPAHGDTTKGIAYNLAPFVDVNNDNQYNYLDGDYPQLIGNDILYFIMSDKTKQHPVLGTEHMGLEVHVTAYTKNLPETEADDQTLFLNYQLFNRSDRDYYNSYASMFTDFDLGGYSDDYVGSLPLLGSYYAYNGDNFDDEYGTQLPACAFSVIEGPLKEANQTDDSEQNIPGEYGAEGYGDGIEDNERLTLTRFISYNLGGGPNGGPTTGFDYYNYARGIWKDNSQLAYGGDGLYNCTSCNKTAYMFPGDSDTINLGSGIPESEWNEVTAQNIPGDRRGLGSVGPFDFFAGGTQEMTFAYIFTQSSEGNTQAADKLADAIQEIKANFNSDECDPSAVTSISENELTNTKLYPNPAQNKLNWESSSPVNSIKIFNNQGQLVFEHPTSGSNSIDVSSLTNGLYLIQFIGDDTIETQDFEVLK